MPLEFGCVSASCRYLVNPKARSCSVRHHINVQLDFFGSVEVPGTERLEHSRDGQLNSMEGLGPATQNDAVAEDLHLERTDPSSRSRADRVHEGFLEIRR